MDILVQGRAQLAGFVRPTAPTGYRTRVQVEITLCALLLLQACIYVCIWIKDARNRGKSIKPIRLQKTSAGYVIAIQSLYTFTICKVFTGVLTIAYCCYNYNAYINNGSRANQYFLNISCFVPSICSMIGFTFTHLNTALMLWRSSRTTETISRTWVITYNIAVISSVVIFVGAVLPLGWILAARMKAILKLGASALVVLDSIITDPASFTLDNLQSLQKSQRDFLLWFDMLSPLYRAMAGIVIVYCVLFASAGVASLWLVYSLRKQTKTIHHNLYSSGASDSVAMHTLASDSSPSRQVTLLQDVASETHSLHFPNHEKGLNDPMYARGASHFDQEIPISITSRTHRKPEPTTVNSNQSMDSEALALERLVRDLTLSVPLLTIEAAYYTISAGILMQTLTRWTWDYTEFRNDFQIWPECTINNIILAYFICNHWYNPGKHGANVGSDLFGHSHQSSSSKTKSHLNGSHWQGSVEIGQLRAAEGHDLANFHHGPPDNKFNRSASDLEHR